MQGQEKDIVILSFVRANSSATTGFVSRAQRLNVALTRARKSCFIIGHFQTLSSSEDWKSLIDDAKSRRAVVDFTQNQLHEDKNLIFNSIQKLEG